MGSDNCVFTVKRNGGIVWLVLYVDDVIAIGSDESSLQEEFKDLSKIFKLTDLGIPAHILGLNLQMDEDRGSIQFSQKSYVEMKAKEFGTNDCKDYHTLLA